METEELEELKAIKHSRNNIENLEKNKGFNRKESLFDLTKNKICENCENFEKCVPLGQSVRQCQACFKKKDLVEKKPYQDLQGEELIGEDKLEMEPDSKDEPLIVAVSKGVIEMNKTSEEHWNDHTKLLCNENFAVEHECLDIHGVDVVKASNLISNEDEKVFKKKESVLSNKKEYKIVNTLEPTLKKEKFGFSKGRHLLEKDTLVPNEKKEQIIETLDVQKAKEEIELEKRERGWIVNGKNASHSKAMPMKNVAMSDGYSPGKEQRERIKVKALKEKPETQRILGLVARRSESRITSPIHKRDPNKLIDDEIEASNTINVINSVLPSIILCKKNHEPLKSRETQHETSIHNKSNSTNNENQRKTSCINIDEEVLKPQPCVVQQSDLESNCSSSKNLINFSNDNLLYGTQRILQLLAKRNESRITSPIQNLETIRTKEDESTNIKEGDLKKLHKTKKTNVVVHSSKLHNQQQDLSIEVTLPQKLKNSCINNKLSCDNINEKASNSNSLHGMDLAAQTDDKHQNIEPNCILSTNIDHCQFNDNPLYGTHQILELITQTSESNMTSSKQSLISNAIEKSLVYVKQNKISKLDDTMKITNVVHPSCSKENLEVIPSKVIHLNSALCNQIESSNKNSEGMTSHSNKKYNILKLESKQKLSRQNSPISNFSTPSSIICHVNDNPLYGSKFESEPSNCTFNNAKENNLYILNQSSIIVHNLIGNPLSNLIQKASRNCDKKECTTLLIKNSSIYNSSEMTPLYKSAIATPICKSPKLSQKDNKMLFQIEPKTHIKEVEIVEEESSLDFAYNVQLKENLKVEKDNYINFKTKDDISRQEGHILNTSNAKNIGILDNVPDGLKKELNANKGLISNYNLEVNSSSKNTSKGQIVFWPMHILFKTFTYPFKLVLKLMLYFVYIIKALVFGIIRPFRMLKDITFLGIGTIRSRILKHFRNGCNISEGYPSCGCATKTYILIVLSSLVFPSLFDLDFYLVNRFIEGQVVIREALNFDYTKEHPTAMVNLLPQQIIGKAKGYFSDKEVMGAHAFPPSHIYHIIVHLTVPESQYNHEIGMFQVVANTFSTRGHSLTKASRASMLRYHSPPVKYMKSVIMGIPILLGLSQESQTLLIKVMESQNENEHSPTASVRIDIEPKAGHLTGSGVPEIYHSELQVIAHNPYLREVARNWIWSLYMYSGLALFAFEVLLVLCCCRRIFPHKISNENTIEEFLSKEEKLVLKRRLKHMQLKRRLHKQHIYFPKDLPLALPSSSNVIECKSV